MARPLLHRLAHEARLTGDGELEALHDELLGYPGETADDAPRRAGGDGARCGSATRLSFFSTVTTFGTATDVTVSELSIEAFFPADPQTAERLRKAAA